MHDTVSMLICAFLSGIMAMSFVFGRHLDREGKRLSEELDRHKRKRGSANLTYGAELAEAENGTLESALKLVTCKNHHAQEHPGTWLGCDLSGCRQANNALYQYSRKLV